MKKLIFSLLMLLTLMPDTRASHFIGGDMTAIYDVMSGTTYVKLMMYRDANGSQLGTVNVDVYQYDNVTSQYLNYSNIALPTDAILSAALSSKFAADIEVGVHRTSVTLPPGKYILVFNSCCRSNGIYNGGANENLVITADLLVPGSASNSTPDFLHVPIVYFPIGKPGNYNPLPYDAEGDSLSWAFKTPMAGWYPNQTPSYVSGYSPISTNNAGPLKMNKVTGEISLIPNTLGRFVHSFEVKEYRNGTLVGSAMRDMNFVILPDTNSFPITYVPITPFKYDTVQAYNYVYYDPGQPFVFDIKGMMVNPNVALDMTVAGGLFLSSNPPVFTTVKNGNEVTGKITWAPSATMDKDHVIAFRVSDTTFVRDMSLVLRKNPGPQTVNHTNAALNNLSVYPNPVINTVNVSLSLDRQINSDISVYNMAGQKAAVLHRGLMPKGQMRITEQISLPAGIYQIVVKDEGTVIKSVPVVIQ